LSVIGPLKIAVILKIQDSTSIFDGNHSDNSSNIQHDFLGQPFTLHNNTHPEVPLEGKSMAFTNNVPQLPHNQPNKLS
jgi:hypothetical protein